MKLAVADAGQKQPAVRVRFQSSSVGVGDPARTRLLMAWDLSIRRSLRSIQRIRVAPEGPSLCNEALFIRALPMENSSTTRFDSPRRRARRGIFGLSVIGIGVLALLDNLHVFDIALLKTFWPLVFVILGISRLGWGRHPGSRLFGLVLILVGALMTAHNLGHEAMDLRRWWPVFVILAGASIALRGWFSSPKWDRRRFESSAIEHTDEVNVDATFSGIKLQNDSRTFKGGRIVITFGGLELDLREAAMDGAEVIIEIDAKFSGIELRVPRDWQVIVQMQATMGSVEDKSVPPVSAGHRLVLRGETLFGGVEIKN